MARTEQVIRGRLGNAVFYRVNGRTYVRSLPLKYRDACTPVQQFNRQRLMVAVRFYQRMKDAFLRGVWRVAARRTPRNGYCLFLKMNMQAFDARTLYDPGNLVMSLGPLPRLNAPSVSLLADNRVRVEWKYWSDKEMAHAGERLCIVVLFEDRLYSPKVLEGIAACRGDRSATFGLGEGWCRRAHLYCFFASPDGGAYSPSDYLCVTPKASAA